jgi:hypothetical protein
MAKYLLIYRNPPAPEVQPSPEEMQGIYALWNGWKEKFKAHVVDMGDGLKSEGRLLAAGKVTDLAATEAKEISAGFSIIDADSPDLAVTVARECPIAAQPGAVIEIREMMGY